MGLGLRGLGFRVCVRDRTKTWEMATFNGTTRNSSHHGMRNPLHPCKREKPNTGGWSWREHCINKVARNLHKSPHSAQTSERLEKLQWFSSELYGCVCVCVSVVFLCWGECSEYRSVMKRVFWVLPKLNLVTIADLSKRSHIFTQGKRP